MEWSRVPDSILDQVKEWLTYDYDAQTREDVQWLVDHNPQGLAEAFSGSLEFGTGGLRGLMGVGPNRMNIYTVRKATMGLARYLHDTYPAAGELRVAIAYDSRNKSKLFAQEAANSFVKAGVRAYIYEDVRPTPQLSFTVRALHCHAGIVVTASHNPKEYNGYKVYWADGGQVVAPHDKRIMEYVRAKEGLPKAPARPEAKIICLGSELDEAYLNALINQSYHPECIARAKGMGIAYTAIHGTGGTIVPRLLQRMGFVNVHVVSSQKEPDGDFPTVTSPNPEDPKAMALACELAEKHNCALVLGTDPDGDRMGAYVRNGEGKLVRLNGNQLAVLMAHYHLLHASRGSNPYIVRTIVTTPLLDALAHQHDVECLSVLTGFKYIAEIMGQRPEGFIFGCEESHGYLSGIAMRDKDGMQACAVLAEMCAWAESQGSNLIDLLEGIYQQHGFRLETQLSLVLSGLDGQDEIAGRMKRLRSAPPLRIEGEQVLTIRDYVDGTCRMRNPKGEWVTAGETLNLPSSNVLQLETEQGSIITIRPSGTEPKIKYYASVSGQYQGWDKSIEIETARAQRILSALAN